MTLIKLTIVHAQAAKGADKIKISGGSEEHVLFVSHISSYTHPSGQECIDHDDMVFAKIHLKPGEMFFDGVPAVSLLVLETPDHIDRLVEKALASPTQFQVTAPAPL